MLLASARRAVLPALLALLALPTAASAELRWTLVRRLPRRPLRRRWTSRSTGRASIPARSRCGSRAIGRTSGPTLMYLSGGPGGAGVSEMLGVVAGLGDLEHRYRLIGYDQRGTGRSGLLRCPRAGA